MKNWPKQYLESENSLKNECDFKIIHSLQETNCSDLIPKIDIHLKVPFFEKLAKTFLESENSMKNECDFKIILSLQETNCLDLIPKIFLHLKVSFFEKLAKTISRI